MSTYHASGTWRGSSLLFQLHANLQGLYYHDALFMREDTDGAKQPEGRKSAPGWNLTPGSRLEIAGGIKVKRSHWDAGEEQRRPVQ